METRSFLCERAAYESFKENGLREQHIVPNYCGAIDSIRPATFKPHLKMFCQGQVLAKRDSDRIHPEYEIYEFRDRYSRGSCTNQRMLCRESQDWRCPLRQRIAQLDHALARPGTGYVD